MSSNRISSLLAWCAANGIVIDPRIEVVEHDTAALSCSGPFFDLVGENTLSRTTSSEPSIRVCSRREHIDFPCTLVYIPKTAVLSAKSCFFAPQITPIPYGHGAQLTLALALYGELLRGSESRWFGYLQSLPRKTVDIAAFWAAHVANLECCVNPNAGQEGSVTCSIPLGTNCSHCTRIHDERNARAWLGATEAEKELRNLLAEIYQYYMDVVEPMLRQVCNLGQPQSAICGKEDASDQDSTTANPGFKATSLSGFCHAYSLVSSRAFWVDAYHGLSMVPIADAFNHVNENHLHMESDYDVCVECGSFAQCEHDREGEDQAMSRTSPLSQRDPGATNRDEVDYLEMRTVRPVPPHSEVFNTYGSLSNAALLTRYGFMLPENEFDTIRMVSQPLSSIARTLLRATKLKPTIAVDKNCTAVTSRVASKSHRTRHKIGVEEGGMYIGGARWPNPDSKEQGTQDGDDGIANDGLLPSASNFVSDGEVQSSSGAAHEDLVAMRRQDVDVVGRFICVFSRVARVWCADAAWDERDEGLICNLETLQQNTFNTSDCGEELQNTLIVNADGKLSHHFWVFCALASMFSSLPMLGPDLLALVERVENGDDNDSPALIELKHRLVRVQKYIERLRSKYEGDMEGEVNNEDEGDEDDDHHTLLSTACLFSDSSISFPCDGDQTDVDGFSQDAGDRGRSKDRTKPFPQTMKPLTYLFATSTRGPPMPSSSTAIATTEIVASMRSSLMERTRSRDPRIPYSHSSSNLNSQAVSSLTHIPETSTSSEAPPKPVLSLEHFNQGTGSQSASLRGGDCRGRRSSPCEEEGRLNKRARRLSDLLGMYEDSSSSSAEHDDPHLDGSSKTKTPIRAVNAMKVSEETHGLTRRRNHWNEKSSEERDEHGLWVAEDHHLALSLAHTVVHLCQERCRHPTTKGEQHGIGTSAAELGDILDETPPWMWRTRCALLLAVSERSILESCIASWSLVLEGLDGRGG